ncbi:serine/threonine-protein kinase [Streptomyces sp. APSN-46.1]|nr:serine/threonine-protein kinase [Streptomyces sp. APSN-46.1]
MGQVWTAYDRRLDRRVAVKLLRPDKVAGPGTVAEELRRRFVRECRVTAQVDHPGLVTVHDAGSDGDELFLVMGYVEGSDLADHLAEHDPYPWQWAVAVVAQLCSVLSAVHAVPIVHRDLKPRNVMIRPDGTILVLDLGVASVMDTDTTRLTSTGSPIGSPAYMAPEQAMGGAVGPYTDLYALGVLLYELLSGNVPFAGSTALGVLHRHLYEPPLPVRQLRPEVPHQLEALLLHLLAKDPQDRPASAQEVYESLVPLLPKQGTPSGPLDPTRPFLRPQAPWPDRAAVLPDRTIPPRPTAPPTPTPTPMRPDIPGAVDEARKLLDQGQLTQAVDILGGILPAAAAQHGEHSPVVRSLRKQYAATLMDDGQYRRALPELRRLADEFTAGDPQSLRFRYDAAQCLEQLGEPAAALAEYRSLLPLFENHYANPDPGLPLEVRRRIAHLLLSLGDRSAAHDTLARLLFDAERLHGPNHPFPAEVRRTLHWLGQVRG